MMLENLLNNVSYLLSLMAVNAKLALAALGGLWAFQFINAAFKYRLNRLGGLAPRRIRGIPGILFSPLLHGSFSHLFFNSIPFFVLFDFMLVSDSLKQCVMISLFITIISGSLLWLFGRRGVHIGASGLIMGYLGYLWVDVYKHFSLKSFVLSLICLYYFGGLLAGLFPKEERVSWEGHLFGLLGGIFVVFLVK